MYETYLTDLDGPALAPPEGAESNFGIDNRDHGVGYFVVIFCAILSTWAVVLRLASRYRIGRFHIEDIFLVLGFVSLSYSAHGFYGDILTSFRVSLPGICTLFMSVVYGQVSMFINGILG